MRGNLRAHDPGTEHRHFFNMKILHGFLYFS
jgi:hypothetical protein